MVSNQYDVVNMESMDFGSEQYQADQPAQL